MIAILSYSAMCACTNSLVAWSSRMTGIVIAPSKNRNGRRGGADAVDSLPASRPASTFGSGFALDCSGIGYAPTTARHRASNVSPPLSSKYFQHRAHFAPDA